MLSRVVLGIKHSYNYITMINSIGYLMMFRWSCAVNCNCAGLGVTDALLIMRVLKFRYAQLNHARTFMSLLNPEAVRVYPIFWALFPTCHHKSRTFSVYITCPQREKGARKKVSES